MRKRRVRLVPLFFVFCLCSLCCLTLPACEGSVYEMSSLPELSRPYAGEYACRSLTLGRRDCLADFAFVRLTLGADGRAVLAWKKTSGGEGAYSLGYRVDEEAGDITFFPDARGACPRTFPMEGGVLTVRLRLAGCDLVAVFAR